MGKQDKFYQGIKSISENSADLKILQLPFLYTHLRNWMYAALFPFSVGTIQELH